MSNSMAIAAVTITLQALINQGIRDAIDSATVTAQTIDKVQTSGGKNQVNLSLYHTMPKLELGNTQLQPRGKPRGTQKSALALDLYYLIAAYGENGNEAKSHVLLGRVVQLLHDNATLSPADIEVATAREFPDSDLHRQVETIQISPVALTFEDMSKVWQVMQSPLHPSVAYKVSVVMIDSLASVSGAMPVLSRHGANGRSLVQLGMPPMITGLTLPHRQPSARLGDRISIQGEHLEGKTVTVHLRHALLSETIDLSPLSPPHETGVEIAVPSDHNLADPPWLAGFWTIAVEVQQSEESKRTSNEFPLAIAPTVSEMDPRQATPGNLSLTLTCMPSVHPEQRVLVLWGDRAIPVHQIAASEAEPHSSRLTFRIREMTPGVYPVRLRVDGVDSIPVDFATVPWQVDPNQQIRIAAP
ncbi:DUF4255 domain-containing protein [Acaryochloris marina NIES-2412]|uniref:DUF4255 domain-containing protein n=1 Tax=Acaryochloris marina TaxID=155978 RepID=UPI00405882C8